MELDPFDQGPDTKQGDIDQDDRFHSSVPPFSPHQSARLRGLVPVSNFVGRLPVQVAHQIKHQQNDKHESQSSSSSYGPAIGVAAAAEEKDQHNDDE